jgi:GTPase SAR1 family protein
LKTNDKEKYRSINDSLENYLKTLDELEFQYRLKRSPETVRFGLYNTTERSGIGLPHITEKFSKLMKMAEFMKTDVLLSEDDDIF